jgi:hypothetical protein
MESMWQREHDEELNHMCIFEFKGEYIAVFSIALRIRPTTGQEMLILREKLIPLFVWGRFHTAAYQEKQKESSPIP